MESISESVGVVDGAGNSVHTLTYAYVHEYPVRESIITD